jgi:alkanesulfonate monooxygenase SsuD/methylene tetrahydromethanopterin reductase-like flavin-dependent oxidoreductase (luciferase family)
VPALLGFSLAPETAQLTTILQAADEADRRGLDLVGVQDHPYQSRFVDTWTLLTAVGVRTQRLRVFADVACLPLRPPAMLATEVATLDHLTGGRAELGLGAGGFWDAIVAMGGPHRTPGEAVEALEEALDVLDLMWSGQRSVRYDGRHYRLAGTHPGPQPVHEVERWIGANGPRMLRLIGRRATGWIPSSGYVPPEQLPSRIEIIAAAAADAGRDPAQIRRIYNVAGTIAGPRRRGPRLVRRRPGGVGRTARHADPRRRHDGLRLLAHAGPRRAGHALRGRGRTRGPRGPRLSIGRP